MRNPLSIIVAVMVTIFVLISIINVDEFKAIEKTKDNHVKTVTNNFQNRVREQGYLDKDTYEMFIKEISNAQELYDIKLIHKRKAVYPGSQNQFKVEFYEYDEKNILNVLYKNNKRYMMSFGDDFNVEVYQKGIRNSEVIRAWARNDVSNFENKRRIAHGGGMIKNEFN